MNIDIESVLGQNYIIGENIGNGGMGSVYKVTGRKDQKVYAAKIIVDSVGCDGAVEVSMLKKLHHHMLPEIKEYYTMDNVTIIIMEYIKGINLDEYIDKEGVLSTGKISIYLRQLADVLFYMHSQEPPVIYRDLKPANIMMEGKDRLRLIDFGTARNYKSLNSKDTVALGTPGYAAPEQLMGTAQTDVRTDIYALGATMYYLITGIDIGKPPYEMHPIHTIRAGVDERVEEIVHQCLQKNPNNRYQSVAEIIMALDLMESPLPEKISRTYTSINIMITHSGKNILNL